jgi:PAS domain S-box-containing protein
MGRVSLGPGPGARQLAIQTAVLRALAESSTVEEAGPVALAALGERLGWDFGALWVVDPLADVLRAVATWHADPSPPTIERTSRERLLRAGQEMPGQVWQQGRPISSVDATCERDFWRRQEALADELHAGSWFPVRSGERLLAVVEFLSHRIGRRDGELRDALDGLAEPLALFLERASLEEALRDGRDWFATALASIADGVVTADTCGRLTFLNPAAERLLGCSLARDRGRPTVELLRLCDEAGAPLEDPVAQVLRARAPLHTESGLLVGAQTGERRAVEDSATPIRSVSGDLLGVVLILHEITGRRLQEARWRCLADAGRILLSSLDYASTLPQVARRCVPILGDLCTIDVVSRTGALERLGAAARDAQLTFALQEAARRDTPATVGPQLDEDLAASSPLGTLGMRQAVVVPLRGPDGAVGVLTLASGDSSHPYDAADLATAEDLGCRIGCAIEHARSCQLAQDATRSREEFLSIASHQLRAPVTSLQLAIQNLGRLLRQQTAGGAPPEVTARVLETAERSSKRLAALIDNLLESTRIQAGRLPIQPMPTDLLLLARATVERLQVERQLAGCAVAVDGESSVIGRWDPLRLGEVITNLVGNAVRYGAGRPVSLTVRKADGTALLVVRDQGTGIPAELHDVIFEPFHRGVPGNHSGGLGLGLYVVKQLVEAHRGRVRVESEPGAGATFIVELPLG